MFKRNIFLGLLALTLLFSCEEETFDPVVVLGAAPVISNPTSGFSAVLEEAAAGEVFTKFAWSAADFGFDAGITYRVELDGAGGDFSTPINLGNAPGGALEMEVTNQKINDVMLANGFPFGVPSDLDVRVVATVSSDVQALISSIVTITVTPFEQVINYPKLWVPGDYWDPQWSPENSPNVWSIQSNDRYEGYLNFPNATNNFKYTPQPNWDSDYGDTGQDGTLDAQGDNIVIDGAGYYRLNVDLNDLTHTYTRTEWGLIGSATPNGWDSDQDMTYDPATRSWKITLDLVVGEVKFRANDAWDIDFGDNGGDFLPDYGGENIQITEAGNYTIELMLERAPYRYSISKN